MSRGGRTVRSLVVAVAVAGASAAWAAKLDKTACAALSSELAAIKSTGIKADMERGPEWAKANMPPERLQSALRLLELEDQLEFRCSMRGIAKQQDKPEAPGTSAAPASSAPPDSKRAAEQPPRNVPPTATEKRAGAPAMLAPVFKPPVAMQPTHLPPAPPTQRHPDSPAGCPDGASCCRCSHSSAVDGAGHHSHDHASCGIARRAGDHRQTRAAAAGRRQHSADYSSAGDDDPGNKVRPAAERCRDDCSAGDGPARTGCRQHSAD